MRLNRKSIYEINIWPGFVDILGTLLIVTIFTVLISTVTQIYFNDQLEIKRGEISSLDEELNSLIKQLEIESATFRRILDHLRNNPDVQNIDLMNLANFCRNCISKWYVEESNKKGIEIDYDTARETIYGMPYSDYKKKHQREATEEQLKKFNERKDK